MIYGIGTDLTDVKRIEKLHQKYGRAFAERILHPVELTEFSAAVRPSVFLAKRFAAKEAFAKAVGTGIRGAVLLQHIGIGHDVLGKPEYFYAAPLQNWLDEQAIRRVYLSPAMGIILLLRLRLRKTDLYLDKQTGVGK